MKKKQARDSSAPATHQAGHLALVLHGALLEHIGDAVVQHGLVLVGKAISKWGALQQAEPRMALEARGSMKREEGLLTFGHAYPRTASSCLAAIETNFFFAFTLVAFTLVAFTSPDCWPWHNDRS